MYRLPIQQPSSVGTFTDIMSVGGGVSRNTVLIICSLVLFGIVALVCYFYYVAPSRSTKYQPNSEGGGSSDTGKSAELLFFFADWCPHCKAAKPIWNDLKAEYEHKTIKGYTVVFTEIDCSEESPEVERLNNQYSVEGYPTIKLLKDGQVIEYDAKPSRETLTKFLNTVL